MKKIGEFIKRLLKPVPVAPKLRPVPVPVKAKNNHPSKRNY
ncbi:hypothetical protein [Sediminibacterium soli]|nr:hypothetical protein [Sediminibacterium soli]